MAGDGFDQDELDAAMEAGGAVLDYHRHCRFAPGSPSRGVSLVHGNVPC
jgi:hypothetical protein